VAGVCGFCGDDGIVAWFLGPDFASYVDGPPEVSANGSWPACATCLALVESGEQEELLWRAIARLRWRAELGAGSPPMEPLVRQMHQRFWSARPVSG